MSARSLTAAAMLGAASLAACGSVEDLEPAQGAALPPAPYGAAERPGAAELIAPSTQARPGRSDELLRRSQRREPDFFDLPPGGDPAPEETETEVPPDDSPAVPEA